MVLGGNQGPGLPLGNVSWRHNVAGKFPVKKKEPLFEVFLGGNMSAQEMHYFKFVTALIDSGIWAKMSPAARTLYPVLLRFTDRFFKPVYPGTLTLQKLTGFKQKSSIRKARKELADLKIIAVTEGTGRKNTCYHFLFEWDTAMPPSEAQEHPPQGAKNTPVGGVSPSPTDHSARPPYNQIHISINNHVQKKGDTETKNDSIVAKDRRAFLIRRFGVRNIELAESECKIANIDPTLDQIEKILYRDAGAQGDSWTDVVEYLSEKISPGSLRLIENAFLEERDGSLIFSSDLQEYLKVILRQSLRSVIFESPDETLSRRRRFELLS